MADSRNIQWKRIAVEATAIIVSILLAFAIDAWWDGRQEARTQTELVSTLKLDFETTRKRLSKSIALADARNERAAGFLKSVGGKEPVELDLLRDSIAGVFTKIDFEPALSAYNSAVATGKIALVESPALVESIAEFNQALDYYKMHDRIAADIFYLGPIWELRREIGSLRILFRDPSTHPDRFRRTDEEYRQFLTRPMVYAAIEAMLTAQRNCVNGLRSMDDAASNVLKELERLH